MDKSQMIDEQVVDECVSRCRINKCDNYMLLANDKIVLSCLHQQSLTVDGLRLLVKVLSSTAELLLDMVYPFYANKREAFHLSTPVKFSVVKGLPNQKPEMWHERWSGIVRPDIESSDWKKMEDMLNFTTEKDLDIVEIPFLIMS